MSKSILSSLEFGLMVEISTVRGGGSGVFAAKDLYRGDCLGYFVGTIVRDDFSEHNAVKDDVHIGYPGLECTVERFKKYSISTMDSRPV